MARNIFSFFFSFCLFVASSFNHQIFPPKKIHGNQKNKKKKKKEKQQQHQLSICFVLSFPPSLVLIRFSFLTSYAHSALVLLATIPRERERKGAFRAAVYLGWRECRSAVKESEWSPYSARPIDRSIYNESVHYRWGACTYRENEIRKRSH